VLTTAKTSIPTLFVITAGKKRISRNPRTDLPLKVCMFSSSYLINHSFIGLPHCKLSRHLEDRVNTYIKENDTQAEVIIRVLCTTEREVEVKEHMKKKYGIFRFLLHILINLNHI
jgi:hypothetical protein